MLLACCTKATILLGVLHSGVSESLLVPSGQNTLVAEGCCAFHMQLGRIWFKYVYQHPNKNLYINQSPLETIYLNHGGIIVQDHRRRFRADTNDIRNIRVRLPTPAVGPRPFLPHL